MIPHGIPRVAQIRIVRSLDSSVQNPFNSNLRRIHSSLHNIHILLLRRSSSKARPSCWFVSSVIEVLAARMVGRSYQAPRQPLLFFSRTITCCGGPCWYCICCFMVREVLARVSRTFSGFASKDRNLGEFATGCAVATWMRRVEMRRE